MTYDEIKTRFDQLVKDEPKNVLALFTAGKVATWASAEQQNITS